MVHVSCCARAVALEADLCLISALYHICATPLLHWR